MNPKEATHKTLSGKTVSLERSLYGVVIITSCIALLLVYMAFVVNDTYMHKKNFVRVSTILAAVTARNSVGALSFLDDEAAVEVISALRPYKNIRQAAILKKNGSIFVKLHKDTPRDFLPKAIATEFQYRSDYLELSQPILLEDSVIGHVYILVNLKGQQERLQQFIGIGAVILILALMISIFFSRRLIHFISDPIYNLVDLAETVRREKNYVIRAGESPIKELNILVLSLNGMLNEIHSRDIALKENEKKLRMLANYDTLTQLPNRSTFMDALKRAVSMSRRHDSLVAVLFVDLDGFKLVNDTFGHRAGDELLQQVALRLKESVRDIDTIARLAGDEFTLIIEELQEDNNASIVAQKIIDTLKASFYIDDQIINISASIGISIFPRDAKKGETLLQHADAAMYFSKNHGRNRYEFYDPKITAKADRRNQLETELRLAIERGQLSVFYQPKVDAKSNKILGFEALLRWKHPHFGNVSPVEFIPIAESSGLIKSIGEWVLFEACKQTKKWHDLGYTHLTVAVNVSAKQFHLTDFPIQVAAVLRDVGLSPEKLELELTESLVMKTPEKVILMLHVLKNLGIKISIDDFGTGYSSLSYLQRFPIDTLKIDRSFVDAIGKGNDGMAIVTAIISMAHNLELQVIAEGVENDSQLKFLRDRNCEQFQGFYFSKPKLASDLNLESPNNSEN